MTTLILQSAGAAFGGLVGGPLGAALGRSLGGALGQSIDRSLFLGGSSNTLHEGPRLTELAGISSTEGAPIPRVYGRVRLGGTLIWASRFQEHVNQQSSGGKGGGGSQSTTRTYSYTANIAIGLCEGPIAFVRRIWANGKLLDQTNLTIRVHKGTETQTADPLIVAKEGAEDAPAYRGIAYIVFEGLPLSDFGNRVPQFSFEIIKPVSGPRTYLRAINLIPGAGEFVYDPRSITTSDPSGVTRHLNRHDLTAESDFAASLDQLQALCPELTTVQLVISWFGDDLRAGQCTIAPRVETQTANTIESIWRVSGIDRTQARQVTYIKERASYGGTPSDASILRAIRDLKERGLKVILYPFAMMDIGPESPLPDPHRPEMLQPAFPWRGRITCNPAPGLPGSPSGTSRATSEIEKFFGRARRGDFSPDGETVTYHGAPEWGWRRMILHYAMLAKLAGGVNGLIIGSELRDLTIVESAPGVFPAVDALKELADDVKAILGTGCLVTYAADWTEYGSRVMPSGAVRFPLDTLWASPSIDAVGIDAYFPLSDWRDGSDHPDANEARSIYDPDYLKRRLVSGEAFDWYYQDRDEYEQGIRRPITDGSYNKPWVFRPKDLKSWWQNSHYERVDNQELSQPTVWIPESKPIWFTEFGCPAVDRGSNAPNFFPDPKSSENALPPFSRRGRDDLIQSSLIKAYQTRFDPGQSEFIESDNPVSSVYGRRMVDADRMALWAFDARPFPSFPTMVSIWADAENYLTGHWVNGRFEACPLDSLVGAILSDFSIDDTEIAIDGFLDGYVLASPSSARAALEPLATLYGFDCLAAERLKFFSIDPRMIIDIGRADSLPHKSGALISVTRAQTNELPCEVRVGFSDGEADYRSAIVASRRLAVPSRRELTSVPMVVTTRVEAERLANRLLNDFWAHRDRVTLLLRPGLLGLEPGDIISLDDLGHRGFWRINRITDRGTSREIEAHSIVLDALDAPAPNGSIKHSSVLRLSGRPIYAVIDLPVVKGDAAVLQVLATSVEPWPGALSVWRSNDGADWTLFGTIERSSLIGTTLADLPPGPTSRWDLSNTISVQLGTGAVSSAGDDAALSGESVIALQGPDGRWELIAFAHAEMIGSSTWRLSKLLRGLGSSEVIARRQLAAGARAVLLDQSVLPLSSDQNDVGKHFFWRVVTSGLDYMHPTALSFEATIGSEALKPLPPVHGKASRSADGISIHFIRCGRIRADSWVPSDIPMDQSQEAYEIEVLDGSRIVRTLSTTTTVALYTAKDEMIDFSSRRSSLNFRIYQIGDGVGRGYPAEFNLNIQ
ncbi:MAG: glycoside hydrolase/phage tail family protein [Alphaproteobacteria bacterium]